jgi:hypothetical protein
MSYKFLNILYMRTRILLFAAIAAFTLAGCSKKDSSETPTPPEDAYMAFKADATARWENGATVEKNDAGTYTYIIDTGGSLFSSAKYKTGRINADGSDYEFLEFDGTPAAGTPAGAVIRRPSGTTSLSSLEIVKMESGKLWIVFKETATSPERRVVQ